MKYIGVAEAKAKLSETIESAQREPVVILSHGKPTAMLVGMAGMSLDDVASREQASLVKLLAERTGEKSIPWRTARTRLVTRRKR